MYLWIFLWVVSGTKGLDTGGYMQRTDVSACSRPYGTEIKYSLVGARTPIECAVKCFSHSDCEHSIFLSQTRECYLEDEYGADVCDAECRQSSCYEYAEVRNVAVGAVSQCSSEYSSAYSCDRAVDGVEGYCDWASWYEGVGNWVRIEFDRPRTLTHGRFMQRLGTLERNKDVELSFSDGSSQQFQMPLNEKAFTWDDIQLTPVRTSWVKITALTVWSTYNNGWAEIQLFASVRKDIVSPDPWNSLSRSEYIANACL